MIMKILITGANGLLGQKLISALEHDTSVHIIATANRPLIVNLNRGEFQKLDISIKEQVDRVLKAVKPEVVINTAAMTNVDQCETEQEACWKTNVTAVQYLVEACKKIDAHFIHLSTDFIFDGTLGPLDESALPNPVNFYGESKLESERIVEQANISSCIIRTVLVYGITSEMSRSNIVLWVKKSLEEQKSIQVVNDQWRTPTLAEDLAIGCVLAAKQKATGVFHISGKDFLSPYDIAIQTADFFKLDHSFITPTDSSTFTQPAARPLKTGFVIDKAKTVLGYSPRSFKEGLALLNSQLTSGTNT